MHLLRRYSHALQITAVRSAESVSCCPNSALSKHVVALAWIRLTDEPSRAAALRTEGVEITTGRMGELEVDLAEYGWFPEVLPSEA
jgi:hypothetical protein